MPNPKVFRLSFDFKTAEALLNFWQTFQDMNRSGPKSHYDEGDWDDCGIVHKDSLHDANKSVKHFLIRDYNPDFGNGRPVEVRKVMKNAEIESVEIL